jgi:hypothetical protein
MLGMVAGQRPGPSERRSCLIATSREHQEFAGGRMQQVIAIQRWRDFGDHGQCRVDAADTVTLTFDFGGR